MSWRAMIWVHKLHVGLSPVEYRTLMVLAEHAAEDGSETWPAVETIAAEAEISGRSVQRSLRVLEAQHVIRCERAATPKMPACWSLNMRLSIIATVERRGDKIDEELPLGVPPSRGGVTASPIRGASVSPKPVLEPVQEPRESSLIGVRQASPPQAAIVQAFEEWWKIYPRRVAKDHALKAYVAAVKRGATPPQLFQAVKRYEWSSDPTYIPHPATWLNQGRWRDERTPPKFERPRMTGAL